MQLQNPFDARIVNPSQFPEPPALDWYKVIIAATEGKQTKEGDGGYLQITFRILEGTLAGREPQVNLNLYNKDQQTVDIANRKLSAFCHVTGQFLIQDSNQLCNIPFYAQLGPQKSNSQYTECFRVRDILGNEPGKPGTTPIAAAPAPPPPLAQPAPGWPAAPAPAAVPAVAPTGWNTQPAPTTAPYTPPYAPPAGYAPPPAAAAPVAPAGWTPSAPAAPTGKLPWEK